MAKIGFVVLHYGKVEVTHRCVLSIINTTCINNLFIVVVDNDCHKTKEERIALKNALKDIKCVYVLTNYEEKGFSYANNLGYQYLKQHAKFDYIVVCNNDIVFTQKAFEDRLQSIYEQTHFAVYAPDIIGAEYREHQNPLDVKGRTKLQVTYTIWMNTLCLVFFWLVYPILKKKYSHKGNFRTVVNGTCDNIVPCGACLVLSNEFIKNEEKVFEPETEFYYEEYILYHRCMKKGYKIVYCDDIKVIHGDGIATKEKARTDRNKMRFMLNNTLHSAKIYKKLINEEEER